MPDIYPPKKQRAALRALMPALDAASTRLRTDDCGDPVISGNHGHIYAAPEGYWVHASYPEQPRRWTSVKKTISPFSKVAADGDDEGAFLLTRLPARGEASLIRQYLGISKRRSYSLESIARLRERGKQIGGSRAEKSASTESPVCGGASANV